jgi:hypothetical protein
MEKVLEVAQLDIADVKVVVLFLDGPAMATDYDALVRTAGQAGFEGDVVAVWPDEFCRTRFLARPDRHAFFQAAGYDQLRAQINATLRLESSDSS